MKHILYGILLLILNTIFYIYAPYFPTIYYEIFYPIVGYSMIFYIFLVIAFMILIIISYYNNLFVTFRKYMILTIYYLGIYYFSTWIGTIIFVIISNS